MGKIVYRKEFLITDHKISTYSSPDNYSCHKDLVLTDKGIYIVGTPSVEHFKYADISSIILDQHFPWIELTLQNKKLYICSSGNPVWGGHLNVFVQLSMGKELKDDFPNIVDILKTYGYKEKSI